MCTQSGIQSLADHLRHALMPTFQHDGLDFNFLDEGEGTPFVFQHGLGGDVAQPAGVFQPMPGIRFLSLDCRGHGDTRPLGDEGKIGIAAFAGDLAAWLDHLSVARAVIGGISMGAAVALRFGRCYPDRTAGLVLSRPAWLTGPTLRNVEIYGKVAQWLRDYGARRGLEWLLRSDLYAEILRESPDNAASLVKQFDAPEAEERAVRLERIPGDAAAESEAELGSIRVPTLILASRQDVVHPFEFGVALQRLIPDSVLREITPKSIDGERHVAECGGALAEFLGEHFAPGGLSR